MMNMEWPEIWDIQKHFIPHLRPLCEMAEHRHLILSFALVFVIAERVWDLPDSIPAAQLPIVVVDVEVDPPATLDVIRFIGSSLPDLQSVLFRFCADPDEDSDEDSSIDVDSPTTDVDPSTVDVDSQMVDVDSPMVDVDYPLVNVVCFLIYV